ncbi:MAG: restriction endonuclease subunit S [Campylobacter sp.]|uniref:restriction endonuclease subunit S n=1 Tax=Campylobacter sp. TaxID=205 RepID=UPI002A753D9E|nr:restriction endonuclease subunit S [Campylobacter sp.]MCI7501653.1 restriction endonuclease subunit S [Campylobacter sp.]MDY3246663.1 restriction endonuclease subunit S [Campylobacter sp.]
MSKQNMEFKDSGIPWIGEIPKHWEISKIKYVAKLKTGGTPNNSFGINVENNGYPWITPANIDENFNIKADKFITEESLKISNFSLFYSHTILLIGIGATVGKIGYLLEKSYCNQQITALIPFNINSKFLLYYLHFIKHKIILEASTNTLPIINNKILNNISVIYPPLNEQKKIAEFLDKKCEIIDKRLSNLERKIKSLKEYKKSLISECVTTGLNPKNMEFKDSGIPWIGQIPKHWKISKIKYECFLKGRIGWQGLTTAEYIEEGAYLVTGVDFLNGNIDWQNCVRVSEWRFNQAPEIQIKNNDLLITKDGTVGKIALTKDTPKQATLNSGVMLIRPKNKNYYEKFLFYILSSDQFWLWFSYINSGNTTIIHLYQNSFDNFSFTLPPLNEQKEIAEFLDKKCEKIDRLNENYTKQITALKEYKKSLIYECVTGKKEI